MRSLVPLLLLLLAAGRPALAEPLIGDAQIPFSADRSVTWKGKTYPGRVEAMPGKQRHEEAFGVLRVVAILRADQSMAYLMLPDLGVYAKEPFPKAVTEQGGVAKLGQPVGTDAVGGEAARAYRVDRHGSDGSAATGTLWMSDDWIILKAEGDWTAPGHAPEHGTLALSNIRKGPQDPARFEIPPHMNELTPEAVNALMSLKLPKLKG